MNSGSKLRCQIILLDCSAPLFGCCVIRPTEVVPIVCTVGFYAVSFYRLRARSKEPPHWMCQVQILAHAKDVVIVTPAWIPGLHIGVDGKKVGRTVFSSTA